MQTKAMNQQLRQPQSPNAKDRSQTTMIPKILNQIRAPQSKAETAPYKKDLTDILDEIFLF